MARITQQKQYTIKIFDKFSTTSFVKNIDPILLKSIPSFKAKINSGLGEAIIDLNLPFDDFDEGVSIDFMNIVDIFVVDELNPLGVRIHRGFISKYEPYIAGDGSEGVRVTSLGLISLLSFDFYRTGGGLFTVQHTTDDPETIARAIIDHFNTIYTGTLIDYTGASTDPVGTSVTYEFTDRRWNQALTKTIELAEGDWWYFIDQDGLLQFKDKPTTATHTFTIGKDVESISAPKNAEKVVNEAQVRWNAGTQVASDATSKTNFGRRTKIVNDSEIGTTGSADQRGEKEVADAKDERIKANSVVINTQFEPGIESIRIGDTCNIRNFKKANTFFEDNLQIIGFSYNGDTIALDLEDFENDFGNELETFVRPDGTGA